MKKKLLMVVAAAFMAAQSAFASNSPKGVIYVNEDVTTHVVMPENIKMVDISTELIGGNQCADNMLRIKPIIDNAEGEVTNGKVLGTISIVGERNIAQYEIRYAEDAKAAESLRNVTQLELVPYKNPDVSMPEALMAKYAWAIYCSGRKFNNITNKKNGLRAQINNIFTVGDYFFIDFSVENKTSIPYDIDEIRIKLTDKKEVKATNVQTIELTPVYSLNLSKQFKHGYRNVLVIDKLTFPDEKVLSLEISEDQISGRVITLNMEYEDILNADGFNSKLLRLLDSDQRIHVSK